VYIYSDRIIAKKKLGVGVFLKSIELFGFKSFADRTRIEFTKGLAALLGPNGCGKSNIVDALKWVLGEQASKSLRADKMEDVIFNGTETRKPLNVAEVKLTISNEQELLPAGFSEITIKRRLFRSGESQYFINENPVRLKEIRELFFDTGVGKSAYSIMEQGRIDQILSVKPEDRRFVFEEASGITRYRIRGLEAEKKLADTENNMKNLQAIIGEVRKNYENLKKQADKTLKYREYQDMAFKLATKYELLKLKDLLDRRNGIEKREKRIGDKQTILKKKIDKINLKMENGIDDVNNMESRLVEVQKMLYRVDVEKNSADSELKVFNDRIEEQNLKKSNLISRKNYLEDKIKRIKEHRKEIDIHKNELKERETQTESNIEDFSFRIANYEAKIKENNRSILDNEKKIAELEITLDRLRETLRSITDSIVSQLDKKLKETEYSSVKKTKLETEIEDSIENLNKLLKNYQLKLKDIYYVKDKSTFNSIINSITEGSEKLNKLLELFSQYKKYNLSFLDDFLSTDGIITQKRNIDSEINISARHISENRDVISELKKENNSLTEKVKEFTKTLEDLRINRAKILSEIDSLSKEYERLGGEITEYRRMASEHEIEIKDIELKIKSFNEQIVKLKNRKMDYEKKEKEYRRELSKIEKTIKENTEKLAINEKELKKNMGELNKIQLMLENIKLEYAKLETEIKNVYENYRERYSRDLTEYENDMFSINETSGELRRNIVQLRKDISALGQVNLMALEEYGEAKERYDFLNNQIEDLEKARNDLNKITEEIKKESTELFISTYENIKRNFHLMFRRLFGGGRAELALTNPDKPLESGIEIYAQPPGKKLESLALLSGGERSLTAVALMFATYMVKPSPFCILDEIDAAMDEGNVVQFISVLKEFSQQTQFIVITHNKRTVSGAETLYGITMEESGISKMITIKVKNEQSSLTYA